MLVEDLIAQELEDVDASLSPGVVNLLGGVGVDHWEEVRAAQYLVDLQEILVEILTLLEVALHEAPRLLLLLDFVALEFLLALKAKAGGEFFFGDPVGVVEAEALVLDQVLPHLPVLLLVGDHVLDQMHHGVHLHGCPREVPGRLLF